MIGVVYPSGTVTLVRAGDDFSYKTIQHLVGGTFEMIAHHENPADVTLTCYINDEGVTRKLPCNYVGTGMLRTLGFNTDAMTVIRGTMVFVSVDSDTGEDGALNERDYVAFSKHLTK